MSVTINGTSGVTTPGINNSEGYTGDGLSIAAGAPAGAMTLGSSGNLGIGTSSPQAKLHSQGTSSGATMEVLRLANSGAGASTAAQLTFYAAGTNYAQITGGYGSASPILTYNVAVGGYHAWQNTGTEHMRLDASGNLLVGTTTQLGSAKFTMQFDGASLNGACFRDTKTVAGADDMLIFQRGSTQVGSISTTLTTTAYNTASDYRLKENVAPLTNALDTIAALKPCTFTWKADGFADRGFIAHELQEVIPQAVSGEKDAVDDEGNIKPQGVDYGKITPEIVAAIQELKARIEQLEAK